MLARDSRKKLDTREAREEMLIVHSDLENKIPTPFISFSSDHNAAAELPSGVIAPSPVTTTRCSGERRTPPVVSCCIVVIVVMAHLAARC